MKMHLKFADVTIETIFWILKFFLLFFPLGFQSCHSIIL